MRRLIFPSTCPCWRSSSDLRLAASVPNPKCVTKFPGGASRLAALLLAYICPICSLVAPCDPGAAPGTLATNFGIGTLGHNGQAIVYLLHARRRPGGAFGLLALRPRMDVATQDHLAVFRDDRDSSHVDFRAAFEGRLDLVADVERLHLRPHDD